MTDRFNTLTVVLERDIREDDAECTLQAIRRIRGVLSVTGNVADLSAHMAEERARMDIGLACLNAIREIVFPKREGGR